jgi:hypothetical protein
MLMSGRGDPAAPPAPRQVGLSEPGQSEPGLSEPGLSEQRPDPIAAALEVIATSQPAVGRGALPASGQEPGAPPGRDPLSTLTPRETEVLRRIAEGQNTKKMAQEMNVTTEPCAPTSGTS